VSNEKFVRWQNYNITQLSNSINLFLGFATATLGFSISLIVDGSKGLNLLGYCKLLFSLNLLFQLLSILFAIVAVVARTCDFRFTARIVRQAINNRKQKQTPASERKAQILSDLRKRVRKLGCVTWFFFKLQVALFGLGILCLSISILIAYWPKIL
jgi:hypothetical protein